MFEAAYYCSVEGWDTVDTAGPSATPLNGKKLAQSVANHLASEGTGGVGGLGAGGASGGVSSQGLKLWVADRAPLLHHCLSTFMHTRCFLYGDARAKGVAGDALLFVTVSCWY